MAKSTHKYFTIEQKIDKHPWSELSEYSHTYGDYRRSEYNTITGAKRAIKENKEFFKKKFGNKNKYRIKKHVDTREWTNKIVYEE